MCSSCPNTGASPSSAACVGGGWSSLSTTTAWGAAPNSLCLLFAVPQSAVVHPGLRTVKKHQKPPFSTDLKKKYPLAIWTAWDVPAAARSVSRQPKFGSSPAQGGCFELELEGAWSHRISSFLTGLCSPKETWGWGVRQGCTRSPCQQ